MSVEPVQTPSLAPFDLLLASADAGEPALPDGVGAGALEQAPRPRDGLDDTGHLGDAAADPQDLGAQRWGVVVPEGRLGDRLLALVDPLIRHRERQQGAPVRVHRVPPGLDGVAATRWRDEVYSPEGLSTLEVPRYLLLLGDLDEVSLELQQVLGAEAFCGRLALSQDAAYEAYVHKVLRWERESLALDAVSVLSHTAHDGTRATSATWRGLVKPALAQLEEDRGAGRLAIDSTRDEGDIFDPDPAVLLASAAQPGLVLMTVSHGQGAPPGGWSSARVQRERQGALVFGQGLAIEAEHVASRPFAPGGCWFAMSCFGAGTPRRSLYHAWLRRLAEAGGYASPASAVLASLPIEGAPGFVSAVAASALANPDGPLAVLGHMDLAWTFGFQDIDGMSRASRFTDLLRAAAQGRRFGTALRQLSAHFGLANLALTMDYDREEQASALGTAWTPDPIRRARLWMQRQDLGGFVLLGDPAARLAVGAPERTLHAEPSLGRWSPDPLGRAGPELASADEIVATMPVSQSIRAALIERIRAGASVEIEEEFSPADGPRRLLRRVIRVR